MKNAFFAALAGVAVALGGSSPHAAAQDRTGETYAPPSFIAFHQAAYLQLSLTTQLERAPTSSRYVLSALAFDEHISHLIRPVLAYFPNDSGFDGVNFSTTVKLGEASQSVEFFFPFQAMRCYAQYDCTGQQLINAGFVLINGERAGLAKL